MPNHEYDDLYFKFPHIAWDAKAKQNIGNLATIAQKIGENPILTAAIGVIPGGVTVLKGLNMAGKVAQDTGLIGKGTWAHTDPLVGLIDTTAVLGKAMGVKEKGEAGMGPALQGLQGFLKQAAPIAQAMAGEPPASVPTRDQISSVQQVLAGNVPVLSMISQMQSTMYDQTLEAEMRVLDEKMKELDSIARQLKDMKKQQGAEDPVMEQKLKEAYEQLKADKKALKSKKKESPRPASEGAASGFSRQQNISQAPKAIMAQQAIDDEMTKRRFMPGRPHQSVVPQIQQMQEMAEEQMTELTEEMLVELLGQMEGMFDREIPLK